MIETHWFAGKQQYVSLAAVLFSAEPNSVSFVARIKPIKHVIKSDVQGAGEHGDSQLRAVGDIEKLQPVRSVAQACLNLAYEKFTHLA
jgi:hypothetical protein